MRIVGGDSKRRFLLRDTHNHTHNLQNLHTNDRISSEVFIKVFALKSYFIISNDLNFPEGV